MWTVKQHMMHTRSPHSCSYRTLRTVSSKVCISGTSSAPLIAFMASI